MCEENIMRWKKKSWKFCGVYCTKTMEMYCVSCKNIQQTKIQVPEKLNRID